MINLVSLSSRFGIISRVKKTWSRTLPVWVLPLLAGCFSFETAPLGNGRESGPRIHAADGTAAEHVVVANNGWYLFNRWPIATGNAASGAKSPWAFFRDDVHEGILHGRLMRYAAKGGYDVEQLNVFNEEQVLLTIPGVSFPLPIPYIATFHEMQLSGVLVKRPDEARVAADRRREMTQAMKRLLDELPDGGASR